MENSIVMKTDIENLLQLSSTTNASNVELYHEGNEISDIGCH